MQQAELDPAARAAARARMVDGQVRPNRVTDPALIAALRRLPRERFVPPALAASAYTDQDLALGGGRTMLQPMAIARLVQLCRPAPGLRVLVVAAGTGYGAALLAACGAQVTALDDDPALLAIARAACPPEVELVEGPLDRGVPSGGKWPVILIEGGVASVPPAIAAQLAPAGRLVAVRLRGGRGVAVVAEHTPNGLRDAPAFDLAAAPIPGLVRPPSFAL